MLVAMAALVAAVVLLTGCSGSSQLAGSSPSVAAVMPTIPAPAGTGTGASVTAPTNAAAGTPTPDPSASPVTDAAAQKLFARSKAAVALVTSMRISGTTTSNGTTARLDLRFGPHATAGQVTRGGYTFDLVFVGRRFYFRAPVAFLEARYPVLPLPVKRSLGKYVVMPVTSAGAAPYAALATRNALLAGVYAPHPNLRRGPHRTLGGVRCASLVDPGQGTFYVRLDDALPVEVDASVGGGRLLFRALDHVAEPRAPGRGHVVDSRGDPV